MNALPRGGLTLAIDCSTAYLCLALVDERLGVLARFSEEVGRDHAARVVPEIDALLTGTPGAKARIVRVVAGTGPGSYTGLRVALATGAGLARALGAQLVGAPSFAAHAAGVLSPGDDAVITLDARRGNVYAAHCKRESPGHDGAPVVTVLAGPVKVGEPEAASLAPGRRVVAAGEPDAAALATSRQGGPPAAVYL